MNDSVCQKRFLVQVAIWAWLWVGPPLGWCSFFLLCMQFARAQMEKLGRCCLNLIAFFTKLYSVRKAPALLALALTSIVLSLHQASSHTLHITRVCVQSGFARYQWLLLDFLCQLRRDCAMH